MGGEISDSGGGASDIFATTAAYYARYRKPYPHAFFDLITGRFQLNGDSRLLDIGCGTGQFALGLAHLFNGVLAIDVSVEMIAEAHCQVEMASVSNVEFCLMAAEGISKDLGSFRLAIFGSSLHWMDIDDVLKKTHDVLIPGGGVVVAGMRPIWGGPAKWEREVVNTVCQWLGSERRAGDGAFPRPQRDFADALADAGFTNVEAGEMPCLYDMDIPFIIGHLYTTSYCSRALLGDRAEAFEADLTARLLRLRPDGVFEWCPSISYLFADRLA